LATFSSIWSHCTASSLSSRSFSVFNGEGEYSILEQAPGFHVIFTNYSEVYESHWLDLKTDLRCCDPLQVCWTTSAWSTSWTTKENLCGSFSATRLTAKTQLVLFDHIRVLNGSAASFDIADYKRPLATYVIQIIMQYTVRVLWIWFDGGSTIKSHTVQ
jgi:hypothetical protein